MMPPFCCPTSDPMVRGAWVVAVLALLLGAPAAWSAGSAQGWDGCRDQVIATLEAAGLRDYGDVSAYTGATGTGALQAVIERCGYRPERLNRGFCDDLYSQVYDACRLDGFDGMSMAATSWVLIFDPHGPLVERLRRVCDAPRELSRAEFGRVICAE